MQRSRRLSITIATVLLSLASGIALATYSGFAGNGRGGPLASRFTCNDVNRGRVWALYGTPNDGTKSDTAEMCVYNSAGTYTFKVLNSSISP